MMEVEYSTLTDKTVLLTGGNGFLGKHVQEELKKYGCKVIAPTSSEMNLHYLGDIFTYIDRYNPDYIIHMAGYNGGIQFNKDNPASIFIENTLMGINLHSAMQYARNLKKSVSVIASCAWSQPVCGTISPIDILKGQPETTVACHGYAKRNLYLTTKYFREQYGIPTYTACITTMYGPGDTFDPLRTKVMGAMIKRFYDAKVQELPEVSCWGTGQVSRQFVYVTDAAKMLVKSLLVDNKNYYDHKAYPFFISAQNGTILIKDLAEKVANLVGYKGKITWDSSKPTGQTSKTMLVSDDMALDKYVSLDDGIKKTIEYYEGTL